MGHTDDMTAVGNRGPKGAASGERLHMNIEGDQRVSEGFIF